MIAPAYNLTEPIELNPSKLLIQFIALGHILGGVAIVNNNLPLLLQLALLTGLGCHYAYTLYHWRHSPVLKLYCHGNDWFFSVNQSKPPFYTVLRCSYWHPWLVILYVEDQLDKKRYLPILVDSCTKPEFKRLQLIASKWLK